MKMPRRRWIAFAFFAALAVGDAYLSGGATWKTVGVGLIAAIVILGAEYFDGITAGPIEVDAEDGEGGT